MQPPGTDAALIDLFRALINLIPYAVAALLAANRKWGIVGKAVAAMSQQAAASQIAANGNGYALLTTRALTLTTEAHGVVLETLKAENKALRAELDSLEKKLLAAIGGANSHTDRQIAALRGEVLAEIGKLKDATPAVSTLPPDVHIAMLTSEEAAKAGKGEAT